MLDLSIKKPVLSDKGYMLIYIHHVLSVKARKKRESEFVELKSIGSMEMLDIAEFEV